jgi:hypothetical protein
MGLADNLRQGGGGAVVLRSGFGRISTGGAFMLQQPLGRQRGQPIARAGFERTNEPCYG